MLEIRECDISWLDESLPHPKVDANKYSRGKLVVVGGSSRYPGAVCLAASAALRMGAGYVEVFCDNEAMPVVHNHLLSAVCRSWEEPDLLKELESSHSEKPKACLVGSGMDGNSSQQVSFALSVIRKASVPLLVDGGAITALASKAGFEVVRVRASEHLATVVTPHFGEAMRLAQSACIVPCDRNSASDEEYSEFAKALADAYGCTVVLKGPDTFIASSDSNVVYAMRFGTSVLSKAGTGDVLAGIVGSLLAQGLNAVESSILGTSLHALSGIKAQESMGDISVIAEDIVSFLHKAILDL